MPFSRDDTVEIITSHYKFLTTHLPHLEPDHLRLPPPTGWPEVTSESLSRLNKSPAVVDLLRHLPYIAQQACDSSFAQNAKVIDYPHWIRVRAEAGQMTEPMGNPILEAALPPEAVVLTQGDNWASHFVLDTERGTITDWSQHRRREELEADHACDDTTPESALWMRQPTKPIAEFFYDLKQKFLDLEWVPRVGGNSKGIEERWPTLKHAHLDHVADIYQVFGWPSLDGFDRAGCRSVIVEIEQRISDGYLRKSKWGDFSRRRAMSPEAEERFAWATRRVLEIRRERRLAQSDETAGIGRDGIEAAVGDVSSEDGQSEDEDEGEQIEDGPAWVEVRDNDGFIEVDDFERNQVDIEGGLGFPGAVSAANKNSLTRGEVGWEIIASPVEKVKCLNS